MVKEKKMTKVDYNTFFQNIDVLYLTRPKSLYQIKFGLPLSGPILTWIEVTNMCNLRCVKCPHSTGLKREPMMMEMDVFVRIVDQIYKQKPFIYLHMSGEPLLNNKLCDMIAYAKSRGCGTGLFTNATLLTQEMSMRLLQSPLDFISLSFDDCTPEIYEKIRPGAKYEQVKSNIETFLRLRREMQLRKPKIKIEILYIEETEEYVPGFLTRWHATDVDYVGVRPVFDWLGLVDTRIFINLKFLGPRPCALAFFTSGFLVDGTVVPCCLDLEGRYPLGNVLKQDFGDIWNGPNYKRFRREHMQNAIPQDCICRDCFMSHSRKRVELIGQWFLRHLVWNRVKT